MEYFESLALLRMAIALSVTTAFLFPLDASASKLEEWNLKNLPAETSDKVSEKKVTASDLTQLVKEIEQCDDKKDPDTYIEKLYLRDRMIKSFLQQRPVIGMRRDEVFKLLADCSPPPVGTLRHAQTRMFQIVDGTKVAEASNQKPSICLEVRFANDIAYAFRIKLETFEKPTDIDVSTVSKKRIEGDFSSALDKPDSMGTDPWMWKFVLETMLPGLVSRDAEKAGIKEESVARKCYVSLNVSKQGISNVVVTRSSLNPKFDNLVVDTLKRLSAKPGLRLPSSAPSSNFELEIGIELLAMERGGDPSDSKPSRGKDGEE